jgi:hypothetical protein
MLLLGQHVRGQNQAETAEALELARAPNVVSEWRCSVIAGTRTAATAECRPPTQFRNLSIFLDACRSRSPNS